MKKTLLLLVALFMAVMAHAVDATALANLADGSPVTVDGYVFTASKGEGKTNPTFNATNGDYRLYALNTLTVATADGSGIQSMVFTLSAQGKRRMTKVQASEGEVSIDMDAGTLSWTAPATSVVSSVTFTVGEKATYGSDGAGKAGQFDFSAVTFNGDVTPVEPQPSDPTEYTIAQDGKLFTLNCARGYVYYDGSILKGTSDASQASQFAIVSYGETNYLYDATNGAFVVHSTAATAGLNGNYALESTTDLSKAVTGLKWGDTGIASYPYYLEDSYGNWLNMDKIPIVYFNTWKDFEDGNGGNTYTINVVGDFDATAAVAMLDNYFNPSTSVQYVIKDVSGNVVYTTEAAPANAGDNIDTLPASLQRAYCSYVVKPTTIATGANVVDVTVTYSLPFTVSSSYDDATWYFAKIRNNYWISMDSTEPYYPSATKNTEDNGKWAFVGNPYAGFSILNKAAGATMVLTKDGYNAVMRSESTETWDLVANGAGFNLLRHGSAQDYMNQIGSSPGKPLGIWVSTLGASDIGGQWLIEEAVTVPVTYVVFYDGQVVASQSGVSAIAGCAPQLPETLKNMYCTYTYDIDTISTTTKIVGVTATANAPFKFSTDVANAKWYYMTLRGHYVYYNAEGDYVCTDQSSYEPTSDAYMWAFIGTPYGMKVVNKATGKYLDNTSSNVQLSETGYAWTLAGLNATTFGLYNGSKYIYNNSFSNELMYSDQFTNNTSSQFTVTEVSYVTLTYVVFYDDQVVASQSGVSAIAGRAPQLPETLKNMYCTYTYDIETISTTTKIVGVTATANAPFEFSTDVANAKWYYMTLRGHYVYYNAEGDYVCTNQSSYEPTSDAYMWAFIGTPYGVKVVNKATGKYLDNTSSNVQLSETGYAWTLVGLNATTFGLYNGYNYINEQNTGSHYLIYRSWFTGDTGSQFTVKAAPIVFVNVTYDLYENGTKVDSKVVEQESNSEVAVPSTLTAAYNALAWDITTEGTVGSTDCTINVTATPKPGVVTDLANLSHEKVYRLVTARGNLGTDGSHLATDGKDGITLTGTTFAFPTYGTDMYLYSVADNKFVANVSTGDLTEDISTLGALVIDGAKGYYFLGMGSNSVNVSTPYSTGIAINSWAMRDAGNQYVFIEAGSFDPTAAEAALATYFDNVDMTAQVMAEFIPYVLAMPIDLTQPKPAASLNKPFGITTAAAYQLVTTYQTQILTSKFSLADYNAIKEIIEANIIYPETGYYRLKNKMTGNEGTSYGYMGMNANAELVGNVAEADAMADASTVFYVKKNEAGYYSFRSQGLYGKVAETSATVTVDHIEHNFIVGHAGPGYGYIKTKSATDRSCYHASATQGYMVVGWGANADASQWVFEPATDVTVNMNVVGDASYATAYFPFPVQVAGAKVMRVEANTAAGEAYYFETANTIPAGTPVMLVAEDGAATATATIIDSADELTEQNDLVGHYLAGNVSDALVLGASSGVIGFYKLSATGTLGANRAYIDNSTSSDVRALVLAAGETTGITGVATEAAQNGEVYDLSGRRVQNVGNGLYIINGKKVLVK